MKFDSVRKEFSHAQDRGLNCCYRCYEIFDEWSI